MSARGWRRGVPHSLVFIGLRALPVRWTPTWGGGVANVRTASDARVADSSEPSPEPVASPKYGSSRSPSPSPKPVKPFRDDPSDDEGEPEQSHHEMLQQQQEMMDGECWALPIRTLGLLWTSEDRVRTATLWADTVLCDSETTRPWSELWPSFACT